MSISYVKLLCGFTNHKHACFYVFMVWRIIKEELVARQVLFFVVEKSFTLIYNTYNRQAGLVRTDYMAAQLELVLSPFHNRDEPVEIVFKRG